MRTVILASIHTYARRYVAALVAVVIATAFIVAINAVSTAAREGSGESVAQQYGQADLALPGPKDAQYFADASQVASADPEVNAVATSWSTYAAVTFPDGTQSIGIGSVASAPSLRWQDAATGRLPAAEDEIAISSSKARTHGLSIGDPFTLDLPGGERRVTVTGTVNDLGGPLSADAYLTEKVFTALPDLGYPTDAVLAVDGDVSAVESRLEQTIGAGSVVDGVTYRETQRLDATQGIDIFQKLIYVFAGISLFVGALVIANTFTILLAQRSHDLALLRCVGAARSQVARSVVIEGALIGLVGSVLGVAVGLGIALAGTTVIGTLSPGTPMGTPSLTLMAVAIPALLGVAVTVAAAWLPARRAGARSPLTALHPQDVVAIRSRSGAFRFVAAAGLLLAGGTGLMAGLAGSLPVGMLGGALSFIGVLLLTPIIVPGAISMAGPVIRRLGLAGRLAHSNSLRNPRRTAATSTALLIGVTLITAVVVGSASISDKVNTSLDANNPVDLIVGTTSGSIPHHVTDEISEVDGVAGVAAMPGVEGSVGGHDMAVLGLDPAALALVHGSPALGDLGTNEIVLPDSLDLSPAPETGDTVKVTIAGQTRAMKVLFNNGLGDAPLVSRATLDSMGASTHGTHAIWVGAASAADAGDVTADVTAISETSDLVVSGGLPDRAKILDLLDVVLAVTIGLLAVAVLIALIGVGNTLSLSVLERVRENSLLRALGLSRSGLRVMLAFEALLMAGVSAVLGIALGTTYAWFGVRTASVGVFDTTPGLTVPWGQIGLILVVAALAGLAACVLPARRAARITPAAGLVAD